MDEPGHPLQAIGAVTFQQVVIAPCGACNVVLELPDLTTGLTNPRAQWTGGRLDHPLMDARLMILAFGGPGDGRCLSH